MFSFQVILIEAARKHQTIILMKENKCIDARIETF